MLQGTEQEGKSADTGRSFEIILLYIIPVVDSAEMCIS